MRTLIFSILFLLATLPAHAEDMHEYLDETRDLVREGEHEEALERFIWFHNHALEQSPSMYGVRLSFALSYWKQLGEVYPPALEAMESIRDEKTALLEKGEGNIGIFHDVIAFNRTLDENKKTLRLFEQIDEEQPERAGEFWPLAKDVVLDKKRYELARKYVGDPVEAFDEVKANYERLLKYDNALEVTDEMIAFNENRLVEESVKLIDLALEFENREAAIEIQEKALSLVDDDRLRDAVENPDAKKDE